MRIVGGNLRGRRFDAPSGSQTRPTSERVREALTSALASRGAIEGARVLDLFAGTGALAFEALSRGAASAVLNENDRRMHAALRKSTEQLGLRAQVTLRRRDVFKNTEEALGDGPFDLVFIDPPYAEVSRMAPVLAQVAAVCSPDALVVLESDRRAGYTLEDTFLCEIASYEYGDTSIRFAAREDQP